MIVVLVEPSGLIAAADEERISAAALGAGAVAVTLTRICAVMLVPATVAVMVSVRSIGFTLSEEARAE